MVTQDSESWNRWPITSKDRKRVVERLLDIVTNGSPIHSIRAARTLIEMDAVNVQAMDVIDKDLIVEVLNSRKGRKDADLN